MLKLKAYPVYLILEAATAFLFGMVFTMSSLYQVQSANLSAIQLVLAVGMIWLIDVFRSLNSPLYTTWVNQRLDPQVRATVLSMSSQVDAIGQITSGPVLGVIGSKISVRAAITASGLLLAPILGLLLRALRLPTEPAPEMTESPAAEPGESPDILKAVSD